LGPANLRASGAIARAVVGLARLAVNPFENRRILASAALRRGDDFGMVPPIWGDPFGQGRPP